MVLLGPTQVAHRMCVRRWWASSLFRLLLYDVSKVSVDVMGRPQTRGFLSQYKVLPLAFERKEKRKSRSCHLGKQVEEPTFGFTHDAKWEPRKEAMAFQSKM